MKNPLDKFFKHRFGETVTAVQTFPSKKVTTTGVITGRKLYQCSAFRPDAMMVYYLVDPDPEHEHDEQVWVLEREIVS